MRGRAVVNPALSKGHQLGLGAHKIYPVTSGTCELSFPEVLLSLGRQVWMKACSEAWHSPSAPAQGFCVRLQKLD